MREQSYDRDTLIRLQGRVSCKLAEIHQMLAPGCCAPIAPEMLQDLADRHMRSLDPAAQEKLRLKAIVAYAELERLTAEMAIQLDALTDEMNKAVRNRRAALAYQLASGAAGGSLARM